MSGFDKFDPLFGPDSVADTSNPWSYPWPGYALARFDPTWEGCEGWVPPYGELGQVGVSYCGSPACPSGQGGRCPEAPPPPHHRPHKRHPYSTVTGDEKARQVRRAMAYRASLGGRAPAPPGLSPENRPQGGGPDEDGEEGLFDLGTFRMAGTTFSAQGHPLAPGSHTAYRNGQVYPGMGGAAEAFDASGVPVSRTLGGVRACGR
jgi:hypothetical protein